MELAGKVAVVTGAAGGIGRGLTRKFLAEGASVLMVDLQEDALREAASTLDGEVDFVAADVTSVEDTTRYFARCIERFGKLDIAALNAGILGDMAPITEQRVEAFDRVMAVNVRGVFLGLAESMRLMKQSGGAILVTSSVAGIRGTRNGLAPYSASKHAVIGLMKSAALEGSKFGIRVNSINPSGVETSMLREIEEGLKSGPAARDLKGERPAGRFATPDEIADLATFLVSDRASYCSGSTYMIDSAGTA